MSINSVTPQDWDRLQKQIPAIEKYTELALEEAQQYKTAWAEPLPFRLPEDAKARKSIPIYTGFISYFPRAIAAVAQLSLVGGIQHGQTATTLHWDRSKSGDEKDAMMRHIIDEDWDQVAWRALANLEKHLERKAE